MNAMPEKYQVVGVAEPQIERREYIKYISTYAPFVDKLYVLNTTTQDLTDFFNEIKRYPNVVVANTLPAASLAS